MFLNMRLVDEIINRALLEDIGTGDVTTIITVPAEATTRAYIYAKEAGVVAGLPVAERVFKLLSGRLEFTCQKKDGDRVARRDVLATVSGPAREILTGERVALNFLQHMSGIATRTAGIVEMLKGYNTVVVDTRKTTPGLRMLEKYAVRAGGGHNHRFGLYDAVLIKDNHIKVAGSITKAVSLAKQNSPHTMKVEVEVENLAGVEEAVQAGADIIMLDNMDPETVRKALSIIGRKAKVEISGGVTEENILEYAKAGVDVISMGALTHSVKALDISLDVGEIKTGAGGER